MVQAESLFNDATSLVLYKVAVATAVSGSAISVPGTVEQFLILAGGGGLIGAAVAAVVALIRRRTEDPMLETVIALVTPYASYVIAEQSHTSGVTAVIVSGVVLGSTGHKLSNAPVRLQVHAVYDTVTFLLESVVFALIGLELPSAVRHLARDEPAVATVGAGDRLHSAGGPPAVDLPAVRPDPPPAQEGRQPPLLARPGCPVLGGTEASCRWQPRSPSRWSPTQGRRCRTGRSILRSPPGPSRSL